MTNKARAHSKTQGKHNRKAKTSQLACKPHFNLKSMQVIQLLKAKKNPSNKCSKAFQILINVTVLRAVTISKIASMAEIKSRDAISSTIKMMLFTKYQRWNSSNLRTSKSTMIKIHKYKRGYSTKVHALKRGEIS